MKPRQLAIVLCLLGCGCASEAPSADATCTDTNGLLQGAVVGDYPWGDGTEQVEANATIQANNDDGSSLQIATDGDGLFSVSLPTGTWNLSARNADGDCLSADSVEVEVIACETADVTIRLTDCYG